MEGNVDRNIIGMGGNSVSRRCVCSSEVTSSHPQLEGPVQSPAIRWLAGGEGKGEGEGALLGAVRD